MSFTGGAARIVCTQAIGLLLVGQAGSSMAQPTVKAGSVPFDNEVCAWMRGHEGLSLARESAPGDLNAVDGLPDGSQVWAVGPKGMIVRLAGGRVQAEESGTEADLHAVWVGSADEVWAVGAQGAILRRRDGTWRPMPGGTRECLYAVWGRNARDLWVGGNEGLVLHGNGSTWIPIPTRSRGPISNLVDCGRGREAYSVVGHRCSQTMSAASKS